MIDVIRAGRFEIPVLYEDNHILVVVKARTSKAAARLSAAFAEHAQDRRYLAVVRGEMRQARRLENWLAKDGQTGMVRIAAPGERGAKLAKLETRPLGTREALTLVEATLFTGRAHQIRVQHASRNLPLWGDNRYGHGRPGQQIALFAWRLQVTHPTRKEPVVFCALPSGGAFEAYRPVLEELT